MLLNNKPLNLFLLIGLIYILSSLIQFNFDKHDRIIGITFGLPRVLSGDVPHYLASVSSLVFDSDFDLANNYASAEQGSTCDVGFNNRNKPINHHVKFVDKKTKEVYSGKFIPDPNKEAWIKIPNGPSARLQDYYYYSVHPPGLPVLLFLFLWPIRYLFPRNTCAVEWSTVFFSIIVTLIGLFFLYKFIVHYGKNRRIAMQVLLLFGLGTPLWHYARTAWPETALTTLLMGALYLLLVQQSPFGAGILIALGISIKFPFVLFAGIIGMSLLNEKKLKAACMYAIPSILVFVMILFYHYSLFGNAFSVGQTYYFSSWGNPLNGFLGMFFSLQQGLFFFAPLLFLSFIGIKRFFLLQKKDAFVCACIFFAYYLFWAIRGLDWQGGAYSNRYLLPVMPLLAIPFAIACVDKKIPGKTLWIKNLYWVLIVYSIVINFIGGAFAPLLVNNYPWHAFVLLFTKFSYVLTLFSHY